MRLFSAVVLTALFSLMQQTWAGEYPERPVRLIVPFAPGGSSDVVGRIIAPRLGEVLGTSVVVENRSGAAGTVGTDFVAHAAPDGYTFTIGTASPLAITASTFPNMPYDVLRDLTPLTVVAMTPEVIAVNPSVRVSTLPELMALAQQQEVDLASSGNGGLPHLVIELLRRVSGGRVGHVPYRGGGPAVVDAVGGQVQGVVMDLPAMLTMVQENRLRGLAVTGERRSALLPQVPTTAEAGLPSVVAVNWFGAMGPPHLPLAIADRLFAALTQVAGEAAIQAQYAAVGIEPMGMASREQFRTFLRAEVTRWGEIARSAGVRSE